MNIAKIKKRAAAEGMTLIDAAVPRSSADSVVVFRKKCAENVCGYYDKSWTCPPAVGSPEDCAGQLLGFDKAVIIFRRYENIDVKDHKMLEHIVRWHQDSTRAVKMMFEEEGVEKLILCEGPCGFCDKCSYPDPCPFPEEQIPSASGYGIDMEKYLRSNGIEFKFSDNEATLYGIILYRDG